MTGYETFLSPVDWLVVAGFLTLTVVAVASVERLKGEGSLPWPLVGLSLISAELTGLGLVALPGLLLSIHGNLAYLQWVLGAVVARVFFTAWLKRTGGRDIAEERSGRGRTETGRWLVVSRLLIPAEALVLSARLMVAALPLHWLSSLPFLWCVILVALFAVACTRLGGTRTLVWCESGHVLVLIGILVFTLFRLVEGLEGGWEGLIDSAARAEDFYGAITNKWDFLDLRTDPSLEFTFWTALLAYPFLQCQLYLGDQGMRNRLALCGGVPGSVKALWWSLAGQGFAILLLLIGMALFVHYQQFPVTDPVLLRAVGWSGGSPGLPDLMMWVWAGAELGAGWKGVILGAFLAAAISGLHGQFLIWDRGRKGKEVPDNTRKDRELLPRLLLLGAVVLLSNGIGRIFLAGSVGLLEFVYGLLAFTTGPLLVVAMLKSVDPSRTRTAGLFAGIVATVTLVVLVRWEWSPVSGAPGLSENALVSILTGKGGEWDSRSPALLASPWLWTTGTLLSGLFAWLFRRKIG